MYIDFNKSNKKNKEKDVGNLEERGEGNREVLSKNKIDWQYVKVKLSYNNLFHDVLIGVM